MPSKKKIQRKTYHHGDLRQAVIFAAAGLIQERGDVSFTVRELASLTGVSHPAIYRHFVNKRGVLAAIAEDGFQRLTTELNKAEADPLANPVQVLRAQAENYLNFALDHAGYFRAMYHAELSDKSDFPKLALLFEGSRQSLIRNFLRGREQRIFREETLDMLTLSFWATFHGLVDLTLQRQFPSAQRNNRQELIQKAHAMVDLLLKGLLNESTPNPSNYFPPEKK